MHTRFPPISNVTFPLVDKGIRPPRVCPDHHRWHKIEHMFEGDLTTLSTPDLLESAADHRAETNHLDMRLLEHAQTYADRHHPDTHPARSPRRARSGDGRERAIVLGGEGCPAIAEFAPAEFGAMIGLSTGAAADLIGQALALRHRLPLTWARVQAGQATAVEGPQDRHRLPRPIRGSPRGASTSASRRWSTPSPRSGWTRSSRPPRNTPTPTPPAARPKRKPANAASISVAPTTTAPRRSTSAPAPATPSASTPASTSIAEALKILGDTNTLQRRRADAVGIIADPRYTEELLHQARALQATHPTPPETPAAPAGTGTGTGSHPSDTTADDGGDLATTAMTDASSDGGVVQAATGRAPRQAPRDSSRQRRAPPPDASLLGVDASTADPVVAHDCEHPPQVRRCYSGDEGLLDDWVEPGLDDEADRDAPHPSDSDLPDPLDAPVQGGGRAVRSRAATRSRRRRPPRCRGAARPGCRDSPDQARRRALDATARARSATTRTSTRARADHCAPGQTEIYIHLTDHTLATGTGVLRVEDIGPLIASPVAANSSATVPTP